MKNICIFFGEEPLSIQKRITRIIHEVKCDDFNTITYDLEIDSLDKAIDDAFTVPFMAECKVVIIKNPTFITKKSGINLDTLKKYLEKTPDYTYLLINAGSLKLDETNDVLALLKKKAEVVNVKKPTDIEMNGWLKMQCNFSGVDINQEAIKEFFNRVSNTDLNRCKNEVEKLINYVGKGNVINKDDVKSIVLSSFDDDVFSLTGAICDKNRKKAYEVYLNLSSKANDVVSLVGVVASSLRNLYAVKLLINQRKTQDMISDIMQIKPGYAYVLMNNSKKLSIDSLKRYIRQIGDVDYNIKSGKLKPKEAFELFLLQI